MVDDPVLRMALAAHTQTIKALLDYIDGREARLPSFARDGASCLIGRWLVGEGARFADLPSYARAKDVHDQFHDAVNEVVALLDGGDKTEAMAKLRGGSPFSHLSRQMLAAFEELSEVVAALPPRP